MKYGNHSFWKRFGTSPFVVLLVLIALFIIVRANIKIYKKVTISDERLNQAMNEVAKLEGRQKDLSARVGQLSTNEGVESEIRTKYMAVKEGESIAVIVDENSGSVTAGVATTTPISWWGRVWRLVFGL